MTTADGLRAYWLLSTQESGLGFPAAFVRREDGQPFADVVTLTSMDPREAKEEVSRLHRGEISALSFERRETFRDWRLIAGARFNLVGKQWQATLSMKRKVPPDKGLLRTVTGIHSPFPRSLRAAPHLAMDLAIDFGKRIATDQVGWRWGT